MKSVLRIATATLGVAVLVTGVAFALPRVQEAAKPAAQETKADAAKVIVPFFGNETCPMSGKPINQTKYVESGGQRAYYCCGNCLAKAKADPKAAVAAAYKDVKATANKSCPVSGHAIDAAKAKEVTFESRKVTLCCGDCEKEFMKSPMLYTTVAAYGAEDLKNKNCPVMKIKEGTDEASTDSDLVVFKGKIVRLCCSDCHEEFAKDPEKYLAKAAAK